MASHILSIGQFYKNSESMKIWVIDVVLWKIHMVMTTHYMVTWGNKYD